MSILVTGGTGYIGSHTVVELLENGYDVVIVDNLCNSSESVVDNIFQMTSKKIKFYKGDIRDKNILSQIFSENEIQCVIHFAGLKAVGESVANPLMYYDNNVNGTICLLEAMNAHNVKNIVFSSSATVYGMDNIPPLTEDMPTSAINPYGWTKVVIERILMDLCASDLEWSAVMLRYFNPVGAHKSCLIGEKPNGVPANLTPFITQVLAGQRDSLKVFGNDYPTEDGTCLRDYIHIEDLAKGHVKALKYALENKGAEAINLGRGKGYSVLEVVEAFEEATGMNVPYEIAGRRPGDVAVSFAEPSKAEKLLGWKAEKNLLEMCKDAWAWEKSQMK